MYTNQKDNKFEFKDLLQCTKDGEHLLYKFLTDNDHDE